MQLLFDNLSAYDEETSTITVAPGDYITVILTGTDLSHGYVVFDLVWGNIDDDILPFNLPEESFTDDGITVKITYQHFIEYFNNNNKFLDFVGYAHDTGFVNGYFMFNLILLDENGDKIEIAQPDYPIFTDFELSYENTSEFDANTLTVTLDHGDYITVHLYGTNLTGASFSFESRA